MYTSIPTIFYDEDTFPHAQIYAEIWSIYAVNMNRMLDYGATNPCRNDYGKIYFACKDKDKFKAIIDSHTRFGIDFIDILPDYSGSKIVEKAIELYNKGFQEVFSDIIKLKQDIAYKEEVINAESNGIYLDPNPDIALSTNIKLDGRKRRKHRE